MCHSKQKKNTTIRLLGVFAIRNIKLRTFIVVGSPSTVARTGVTNYPMKLPLSHIMPLYNFFDIRVPTY